MFSDISGLGGTHVQQSFRSRRNICAAVFCAPFPQIFMCRISLYIQKQFNMSLHVLSTPRGPPARKSSHLPYVFLFTSCTVQFGSSFGFHPNLLVLRLTGTTNVFFLYGYYLVFLTTNVIFLHFLTTIVKKILFVRASAANRFCFFVVKSVRLTYFSN